jgi:hypothetical protein
VGGNLNDASLDVIKDEARENLRSSKYATRTWHGGFRQEWSGKDRYWSDISSARVHPGCTLRLYSGDNRTGDIQILIADNSITSISIEYMKFPAQVGSVDCECGFIPSTDGHALYRSPE